MCVVSMIMDTWRPHIPQIPQQPWQPWPQPWPQPLPGIWPNPSAPGPIVPQVVPEMPNDKLKKLLDTLRRAVEVAEEFDALTGQPDCVDPEKAKLMERVEELERRLDDVEGREVEGDGPEEDR